MNEASITDNGIKQCLLNKFLPKTNSRGVNIEEDKLTYLSHTERLALRRSKRISSTSYRGSATSDFTIKTEL